MKITAFVFAAGLGTRLYPLTANRPKAMVCYRQKPLLEHVLTKIMEAGIEDVVINVHHFPDQIVDFIRTHHFPLNIRVSDERAYLRDTAGGLRFAAHLVEDSDLLVLYNVDILSDIDLKQMMESHLNTNADVTLAVRERKTSRYLMFDRMSMRLCGWKNVKSGEIIQTVPSEHLLDLAFSGIHVMNTRVVSLIPTVEKSSLTPFYVSKAPDLDIRGFLHQKDEWMDVGKYEEFSNILS